MRFEVQGSKFEVKNEKYGNDGKYEEPLMGPIPNFEL
jgi:hypothetical protein